VQYAFEAPLMGFIFITDFVPCSPVAFDLSSRKRRYRAFSAERLNWLYECLFHGLMVFEIARFVA
jgi:hypothetical protein